MRTLELAAIAICLVLLVASASCGGNGGGGDEVPEDLDPRPPVGSVSKQIDRPGDSLGIGLNVLL